jgi:Histidine kinase
MKLSIVKDGALWGLIACHNSTPKPIPADVRAVGRALAGGLSRQIKAREETDDNPDLHSALEEARRRLTAVSLVHRRLYRADQIEAIDGARYIDELLTIWLPRSAPSGNRSSYAICSPSYFPPIERWRSACLSIVLRSVYQYAKSRLAL